MAEFQFSDAAPDLGQVRQTLLKDSWYRGCATDLQDALLAYGSPQGLRAGECLFRQGDVNRALYCVLDGTLVVDSVDRDGNSPLLVVVGSSHWLGELSFTDGLPRSHDATAGVDTLMWCVDPARLHAWLARRPEGWRDLARLAVGRLRTAYQIFDEEMRRPLNVRVARRLWLSVVGWGMRQDEPLNTLSCSQQQLARMLGVSRGSVNRALADLQTLGAVNVDYGRIEVIDHGRLRAAAQLQGHEPPGAGACAHR